MDGEKKKERILCLGDSNTFGYDPRSWFGDRYPADVRWAGRLNTPDREIINCGQNGMCIPREREFAVIRALVRSKRPVDIITVMLGDNDFLTAASAETVTARMRTFLSSLVEASEGERILLIAPPPLKPGEWVQSERVIGETYRLGALYRALAEELGVEFADAADRAWSSPMTASTSPKTATPHSRPGWSASWKADGERFRVVVMTMEKSMPEKACSFLFAGLRKHI